MNDRPPEKVRRHSIIEIKIEGCDTWQQHFVHATSSGLSSYQCQHTGDTVSRSETSISISPGKSMARALLQAHKEGQEILVRKARNQRVHCISSLCRSVVLTGCVNLFFVRQGRHPQIFKDKFRA